LWLALLILLLLPVVELWVLVGIGRLAGFWITVALLALSGIAGAWLVRTEGRRVWRAAQMRLQAGEMPGHAVLDGLCVLLGAVLLIVPGFVTDAAGLVLLLPFTRPRVRRWLLRWLERRIRGGTWFYFRRW
jgi:UPF0716 protein FxsA